MKFFYIRSYCILNVYVVYLCHFSALGTYHMCLLGIITLLIHRFIAELVVNYQVGVDEKRNCIVHCCTAYPEFFLFLEQFQKVCYFKTTVYGIDCIKNCISLRCTSAFVLFQVICKQLVYRCCSFAIVHLNYCIQSYLFFLEYRVETAIKYLNKSLHFHIPSLNPCSGGSYSSIMLSSTSSIPSLVAKTFLAFVATSGKLSI